MEEEIHPNEDKETLRRRLELLKQEYERTAQRLKRAECRDALRRQSRVSDQNRFTHNESSPCSASFSLPTSELSDNQKAQQLQTNVIAKRNISVKNIPAVQFQVAEIASASPACKRSPGHRLRSKRSRLRLQNKGRESDTDNSQEKERGGNENNIHERGNIEIKNVKVDSFIQGESGGKEKETEMRKEIEFQMLPAGMERNQEITDGKFAKEPQDLKVVGKTEVNCELKYSVSQSENKPLVLGEKNGSTFETSNICQEQLPSVSCSVEKLQSTTAVYEDSIQTSSPPTSSESVHITDKSNGVLAQTDSSKGCDDSIDIKHSSFISGSLDSCTLVEGLPFPVEYYIRTTRRMAASHSSVNLEAVIHSQLTKGRGRRRLSQSQTRGRGHMTSELSESGCKSTDQARRRGTGQRSKRGRRRKTTVRTQCSKAAPGCSISNPASDVQADCSLLSESLMKSKSTPQGESTCQSELLLERPQAGSQPIQLLEPTVNLRLRTEEGFTQDFKHLPDSQLYFESKLLPESNLYPMFRRRRGQTGGHLSQSQTCTNKDDQSPLLPSLASLIQALQEKETKCGLIAAVDIQDFHLPDEDFGQLKLERLRLSTSLVEPFVQRPYVYNTRRSTRCQTAGVRKSNSEVRCTEGELFTPEPPPCSSLEDSLPLCHSDPIDQSQNETRNTDQSEQHSDPINQLNTTTSDLVDNVQEQTQTDKISQEDIILTDKRTVKVPTTSTDQMLTQTVQNKDLETSETENVNVFNINPQVESQVHKQTESNTLPKNSSFCSAILNLSPSLTSNTQKGQDPALPSLGTTPQFLSPGSPIDLQPHLSPANSCRSSPSNMLTGHVPPDSVSSKTLGNVKTNTSVKRSDLTEVEGASETQNQTEICQEPMMRAQNNVKPQISTGFENLIMPETKIKALCILECEQANECSFDAESNMENISKTSCTSEIEDQLQNVPESKSCNTPSESAAQLIADMKKTQINPETEGQTYKHIEPRAETQSHVVMNQCGDESGCAGQTPNETICLETSTNQRTEEKTVCTTDGDEAMEHGTDSSNNKTLSNEETPPSTPLPDVVHCSAVLREMHTFKALEGGCVLDLCLVQWSLEDWCICVAGEWSVCVWTRWKEDQPWSLLHTWTFAQSVVSLQVIPESSGVLCVTLGHLEITEARVLCCPSMDGPLTQTVVCRDALQAVVGVSNCRLVCCSTPGDLQKVIVIAFTREGRVVSTLPLVSVKQNIRTLAAVEGERDALIGWTECKTLLIWSMKSGHLLQTIYLEKTLTMTNCMRGYSYRGVLCILLQNTGNVCDDKSNTSLFTLIATNPLTGKHSTLTSINNPAQHIQQLIDGDVFGSGLVGVFQSGHVAVWDLRGRVAKVVGVLDELCRLARWAGPETLLTGYLNGDVSVFQYKTT